MKSDYRGSEKGEGNMEKIKPGPLANVNVLDFTWVLAGPYATKNLVDMGANVIKVEHFKNGTNERHQTFQVTKNGVTQCSYHLNLNRGKKSVCINLKHPQGIELIHDLLRKTDILIENFAPGVMERLGLDYEGAKKIKPDIIYCSISAWGHWGPNTFRPGYDSIAQAASGWVGMTEHSQGAPVAIGDTTAAMHACSAMLAALYHRTQTGQGQNIDISMVDCLFAVHETSFPAYWISEAVGKPFVVPKTDLKQSHTSSPYGLFDGKNGSISIALLTDARWPALVDVMGPGYEWLKTDPRTRDLPARCAPGGPEIVHEALGRWVLSQESVEEAERKLMEAGIACCRVRSIEELATTDPHISAREMRVEIDQPFLGPVKVYGSPLKFSGTYSGVRDYAPFIGQHNREVLLQFSGSPNERIDDLYRSDVLFHAPEVERLPEELEKITSGRS